MAARTFRGKLQPTIEIPPYVPPQEPASAPEPRPVPCSAVAASGVWPLPSSPEIPHLVSMRNDGMKNPAETVVRRRWVVPPTDLAEQQGGAGPVGGAAASASTPERVPEEEIFSGEDAIPP